MNALDAIGNPIRRKILVELRRTPLPVGVFAKKFSVSRPAISRDSFKRFQLGLRERCEQAPVATELFAVDSYPMP